MFCKRCDNLAKLLEHELKIKSLETERDSINGRLHRLEMIYASLIDDYRRTRDSLNALKIDAFEKYLGVELKIIPEKTEYVKEVKEK